MSAGAPGEPGIPPTWCSSAKQLVGCSLGASRIWFTLGGGILNEVYYPRVDIPQIRDLGFIVADGRGFWVEVKRLPRPVVTLAGEGVPAVTVVHRHERFELTLRIVPCISRDALLIAMRLTGDVDLRPYVLLAPHLGGTGHDNHALVTDVRGRRVLAAQRGPFALALLAVDDRHRDVLGAASAGYVGTSDGWQDFARHGAMTWQYSEAGPGNVALLGTLPRNATLALGFAAGPTSAATVALTSLLEPFERTWVRQTQDWQEWHARAQRRADPWPQLPADLLRQLRTSAMVLRVHQDKVYPGTMVASLSVPWGNTRDEIGGYHLVWPRDLSECASALLALGAVAEARNTLRYLIATQQPDGHWNQNQWLGGTSYWTGLQLDETAFPVLLAVSLAERAALDGIVIEDMIRRALCYLVMQGPVTEQDRWEEDAGINPFTLGVCIAALVCGSAHLEARAQALALAVADFWNTRIEAWTAARGSRLAAEHGVDAYYVRVAPASIIVDPAALETVVPIKNRNADPGLKACDQIGVDFLQLVRFGLRAADDPLIRSTIKIADALLRAELPTGPSWYRYCEDGYGEHEDGSAYDGSGRGRPWPLLGGERGHYELVAGADPLPYLRMMAATASEGGMIPEQVWDAPSIPERFLVTGHATGSAMPLAWAHAEYVKLAVSRELRRPFDRPSAVWERYGAKVPRIEWAVWTDAAPIRALQPGLGLIVGLRSPGEVIWTHDEWRSNQVCSTEDSGLGLQIARLPTASLPAGARLELTYRLSGGQWAGRNFGIDVRAEPA
jgi:glucoamylase